MRARRQRHSSEEAAAETRVSTPLCDGLDGNYSVPLHVLATIIVLLSSLIGVALPLVGKRVPSLSLSDYVFSLGKNMGTGVMLAVGFVHLLGESIDKFRVWCMPDAVFNAHPSLVLVVATTSVMGLHFVDLMVGEMVQEWFNTADEPPVVTTLYADTELRGEGAEDERPSMIVEASEATTDAEHDHQAQAAAALVERFPTFRREGGDAALNRSFALEAEAEDCHSHLTPEVEVEVELASSSRSDTAYVQKTKAQLVMSALTMEFGTTLHSVFVGLDVGVMNDSNVKPMLVALVFHQVLEGLAMGARLADADFMAKMELVMMLLFTLSAPVGIALGTLCVSNSRTALAGPAYVLVSSLLDAMCGGVLVYLGIMLLLDFPSDVERVCAEEERKRRARGEATAREAAGRCGDSTTGLLACLRCVGKRFTPRFVRVLMNARRGRKAAGLLAAVWIGALGMCIVGIWC